VTSEFPAGLCVDCGMSVPGGDIICDICKGIWQAYSFSGDFRRARDTVVQSGIQELPRQEQLRLVPCEETMDASLRAGEEG
jgi:hypothetical protein